MGGWGEGKTKIGMFFVFVVVSNFAKNFANSFATTTMNFPHDF